MSKPNLAVAIDAGSHSLKGLVLSFAKNSAKKSVGGNYAVKILKKKFVKLPIAYDQQLSADYQAKPCATIYCGNGAKTASKLGEFILEMAKEGLRNSDKIVVGLGPSLASLSIEKHSIKLTGKEKVLTAESMKKYFRNLGNDGESILLDVLVNGYRMSGLKTINIPDVCELGFKAIVPKFTKEASVVINETKKALGGLSLEFLPNTYLQQTALTGVFKTKDALAIDVGGENTQLSFLKDGSLAEVYAFALGARHFIRGMAKIAGITYEEAEDIKRQYAQNILDESRKKQIHSFLVEESKSWYKMFTEGVGGFGHLGLIPKQVFIFGGGANLPEVADTVRMGDYSKVNILGGESLFGGDTFDGYLHGPEDFNLASMVYYLSYAIPLEM